MPLFKTQFIPFGLDISDRAIKLVQIANSNQGLKLLTWNRIRLGECIYERGEIKNEALLIKSVRKLIDNCQPKISENYVMTCLPETKTFIKLINLDTPDPNQSQEHLDKLIKQELPHHIPLPVENIYLDWQVVSQNKNNFEILIGVAPKEIVNNLSQLLEKCGLISVAMEIEAQSIIRAIFPKNEYYSQKPLFSKEYNLPDILKIFKKPNITGSNSKPQKDLKKLVYIILDFGACRSGLVVWSDKTIKFTSSLKTCSNHLTDLIAQKMGLDIRKAEKLKIIYGLTEKKGKGNINKVLKPVIQELCQEIIKAKDFYQTHFPGNDDKVYEMILTGGSAKLIGLPEYLSKQLNMKVNIADPTVNLAQSKSTLMPKEIQSYTTAIGLALRSFFIKDV